MFNQKTDDEIEEAAPQANQQEPAGRQTTTAQQPSYCILAWLGLLLGPQFIQTDKAGKPLNGVWTAVEGLTKEFLAPNGEGNKCGSDDKAFAEAAKKFAASRGWTLVRNQYDKKDAKFFSSLLEAEGESSMTADQIRERLRQGVMHFKYKKVDKPAKVNKRTGEVTPAVPGEVVERFGTLNHEFIQHSLGDVVKAQQERRIPCDSVIAYFDIHAENKQAGVAGDWRCFRIDHFQGFID